MSNMKRIAEIIEEHYELGYPNDSIVDTICQELDIPYHSAEKLYEQYLRTYTAAPNHELVDHGC
jgi:hypothetical protein